MALKLKKAPAHFDTDVIEFWWPGDPAIDIEQSDLATWCREGGKAGLVQGDGDPTVIKVKRIGSRAYDAAAFTGDMVNMAPEAFRFGFVSADGIKTQWDRIAGVRCLHDSVLDLFCDADQGMVMMLPMGYAYEASNAATDDREFDPKNVSEEFQRVSCAYVIGIHILKISFRK